MVGMGVAELILLAMMAGGGLPQQIAFGNPVIWLAQSVVTRSAPMGAAAAFLLAADTTTLGGPVAVSASPPPIKMPVPVAPPAKKPAKTP